VLDHSPHRAPEPPSRGTSLSLGVQFCKPVDRRSPVAAGEGGALLFECLSLGFRATSAPNKVTILLIFGNNSLNIREAVLLRSCTNAVPIVLP
jgi:hypothetical protein